MKPPVHHLLSVLLASVLLSSAPAQTPKLLRGAPRPKEGTPAWTKFVQSRQEQVAACVVEKKKLIAQLPTGTVTVLDAPYVEQPIQSKIPGSGQAFDLYVPKGEGPFPLIVYIHGGAWNGGNKEKNGALLANEWIPEGFAVASLSYRFPFDAPFPGMFQDCIDGIDFLRKHAAQYHLNAGKVGVCGESAGGHTAALVGIAMGGSTYQHCEKPVQALVVWCGFGDVTIEATVHPTGGYPWIYPNETYDPDIAKKISPIYQIHPGIPPVLVQHGEKDQAVPLVQPKLLADALKRGGYEANLILYPNYDHNLWKPDVHAATLAFFKKHL